MRRELSRGRPGTKTTSTVTAVLAALRAVGARRIAVATPYIDEVNEAEAGYLKASGLDVLAIEGLDLRFDSDIIRVSPDFILEFACAVDREDADAIFVSCGALRAVDVIDEIERRTGKPVVSSNQALMWHCMRLAGLNERMPSRGILFREH